MRRAPSLAFDLDGTLADTAYLHTVAWQSALYEHEIQVEAFEIHRRVGMNGDLLLSSLSNALRLALDATKMDAVKSAHASAYQRLARDVQVLPGATEIESVLQGRGLQWAIVTSARRRDVEPFLNRLQIPKQIPVITQDDLDVSKPSPAGFLAAQRRLGVEPRECFVVGDSVWDMLASRRMGSFGVGVLTGGYSSEELISAGAFRVYRDVAQLLSRIDEFAPG